MSLKRIIVFGAGLAFASWMNTQCAAPPLSRGENQKSLDSIVLNYKSPGYSLAIKDYMQRHGISYVFLGTFTERKVKYNAAFHTLASYYSFKVDEAYISNTNLTDNVEVVYPALELGEVAPLEAQLEALRKDVKSYSYHEDTPKFYEGEKAVIFAKKKDDMLSLEEAYHVTSNFLLIDNSRILLDDFKNTLKQLAG